jgi:hypothetical protein
LVPPAYQPITNALCPPFSDHGRNLRGHRLRLGRPTQETSRLQVNEQHGIARSVFSPDQGSGSVPWPVQAEMFLFDLKRPRFKTPPAFDADSLNSDLGTAGQLRAHILDTAILRKPGRL